MESRNHVKLRTFQEKDFAEVLRLFYDTVRNINSRDYTTEQISAWVLGVKEKRMKSALLEHTTLVATLSVHASITARNFFLQRGYRLIYAQQVERQGQLLTNFYMKKEK